MRGVGIEAGSQIGRCRNRQSFKNQQNLQKAMEEARRLVMRSPLPGSPHFSPQMEILDPTTNTLIELLKNITEEVGDDERLSVSVNDNRGPSPLQQLGVQLQAMLSKNPSPYQTTNLGKAGTSNAKRSPRFGNSPNATMLMSPPSNDKKPNLSPNLSISRINSPPPKPEDRSAEPIQGITVKSPSGDNLSQKGMKTPDSKPLSPKVMSPEPAMSPPPPIHITEPMTAPPPPPQDNTDHLVDIDMESEQNPEALASTTKSPPKVVKRKAPVPSDAIQRPVAPKPTNQGMIPPPPSKSDEPSVPCLNIPILSTTPATPLPKKKEEAPEIPPPLPNTPPPEQPITTQPKPSSSKPSPEPIEPTICVGIDATAALDSSTEQLISSPNHEIDANKAASSPICLRPYRKIEDVKTVKRQPKSGWL